MMARWRRCVTHSAVFFENRAPNKRLTKGFRGRLQKRTLESNFCGVSHHHLSDHRPVMIISTIGDNWWTVFFHEWYGSVRQLLLFGRFCSASLLLPAGAGSTVSVRGLVFFYSTLYNDFKAYLYSFKKYKSCTIVSVFFKIISLVS